MRIRTLCLMALVTVEACTCNPGAVHWRRSGTKADDNVEEPVPDDLQQFAPLLEMANKMTALILEGRIRDIYGKHAAPSLKKLTNPAELERLYAHIVVEVGRGKSFKPNQWSFRVKKGVRESFVESVKVVIHERGKVYYAFTFADEHADRIIGLHLNIRKPDAVERH